MGQTLGKTIRGTDFFEKYTVGKKMGGGTFGIVKKCVHKVSGQERAVKTMKKRKMGDKEKIQLKREIETLKKIDHPNVMRIYEYFEDEIEVRIVTELVEGGELFDEILRRDAFNEAEAGTIMKEVLACMKYIHKKGIMHRDLKPDNIMLEKDKKLDQIKIIDFGFSRFYKSNEFAKTTCGTLSYTAPEIFKKNYTEKCDIWACGVITFALISGILPFTGLKEIEQGEVNFEVPEFE